MGKWFAAINPNPTWIFTNHSWLCSSSANLTENRVGTTRWQRVTTGVKHQSISKPSSLQESEHLISQTWFWTFEYFMSKFCCVRCFEVPAVPILIGMKPKGQLAKGFLDGGRFRTRPGALEPSWKNLWAEELQMSYSQSQTWMVWVCAMSELQA